MQDSKPQKARREFVKTGALGAITLVAVTSIGCSGDKKLKSASGKKDEILHRSDTKYWREYLSVAK